jgi:hypothetical protein
MRRYWLVSAILSMGILLAQGQPSLSTNGLVLYYPFNGSAREVLTAAPEPTSKNISPTTDRGGTASSAFAFNGTDSSIYQPEPIFNIGDANYTISFWFKIANLEAEYQALINTVPHNGVYIVYNHPPALDAISFRIGDGNSWISAHTVGAKNDYNSNEWYHVVLTKTGTAFAAYVNAELDSTVSVPSAGSFNRQGGFHFGAIGDTTVSTAQHLNGSLDDVKVFDRALDAGEVEELFAVESGIPRRATARLQVVNGFIVGVVVEDGGYGYTTLPNVIIRSTSGTGAVLTPVVVNGRVSSFTVVSAGTGYDDSATISIASPPFLPSVAIAVSKVNVTLTVVQGSRYVLESSHDVSTWTRIGEPFIAQEESISQEFAISETGRYFRIQQLP